MGTPLSSAKCLCVHHPSHLFHARCQHVDLLVLCDFCHVPLPLSSPFDFASYALLPKTHPCVIIPQLPRRRYTAMVYFSLVGIHHDLLICFCSLLERGSPTPKAIALEGVAKYVLRTNTLFILIP